MDDAAQLHQHWRDFVANGREAAFCVQLVEQYLLKASKAWRSRSDALAIILIVEPEVGTIRWQIADKNALIEVGDMWQESRALLGSVAERFGGFINWMVGIVDRHGVFLHVARTREEPEGIH